MAATTLLSDNGVSSGITGYQLTGGDDGTLELQTTTAGGTATTAMTINASQNVGIGSTPGENYKLEVAGRISISGSSYITNPTTLVIGQYSSTEGYIQVPSSGKLNIWDNGTANIASFLNNGNFQFNSGYGSAATAYGCRAWVNFNGTGTVAIRASGNVSSITDNGTGNYTVNFTTSMPDANYSAVALSNEASSGSSTGVIARASGAASSSAFPLETVNLSAGRFDSATVYVSIFR